ncbi:tol-pal system-associated acyl-CoA thioesterase [Acerihabitans sp. TG2]|nr:tol-pal system-associated acyl-CoA thioesterase [Acerihabitans sp. TG2]MEA9390489.1 tol-pal system-associated acyl-CoA thioesterase [Acerihabitans sp. TG2]
MVVLNIVQALLCQALGRFVNISALLRRLLSALFLVAGLVLVSGLAGIAVAAPATVPVLPGDGAVQTQLPMLPVAAGQPPLAQMDLSVLGMYQHADVVVKTVMIGLLIASIITWALFFGKSAELLSAKRRLGRELAALKDVRNLDEALSGAAEFPAGSVGGWLLAQTQNELALSAESSDNNGIKERAAFRLERSVAATSRMMGKGNGFLATIGAISPFIGLFGTVWGIMNSFIGIAQTQTTNLAVVAPGIAEALLATAIGLFAAIPAVVIYNIFARTIAGYKAMVGDYAAQVLLLLSRDLDLAASADSRLAQGVAKYRIG